MSTTYITLPCGSMFNPTSNTITDIKLMLPNGKKVDLIEFTNSIINCMEDPDTVSIQENWLILSNLINTTKNHYPNKYKEDADIDSLLRGFIVGRLMGKFEKNTNLLSIIEDRSATEDEVKSFEDLKESAQKTVTDTLGFNPMDLLKSMIDKNMEEIDDTTSSDGNGECTCESCRLPGESSEGTTGDRTIEPEGIGNDETGARDVSEDGGGD